MTHEEHCARAMLMGLVYDWTDRSYNERWPDGSPVYMDRLDSKGEKEIGALDADTLEWVPLEVLAARKTDRNEEAWMHWPEEATS